MQMILYYTNLNQNCITPNLHVSIVYSYLYRYKRSQFYVLSYSGMLCNLDRLHIPLLLSPCFLLLNGRRKISCTEHQSTYTLWLKFKDFLLIYIKQFNIWIKNTNPSLSPNIEHLKLTSTISLFAIHVITITVTIQHALA